MPNPAFYFSKHESLVWPWAAWIRVKMAHLTSKWFDPDHIGVTKYEATSKGYFVPADRDPDHIQRIKNGDLSTEVKILYADGCFTFYC